jgi:hypothetical protein
VNCFRLWVGWFVSGFERQNETAVAGNSRHGALSRHVDYNVPLMPGDRPDTLGVIDRFCQTAKGRLLNTAISHAKIAGTLVQISIRPYPRGIHFLDGGGQMGIKGAIRSIHHVHGGGGICYIAIPDENHFWIFILRIALNKITEVLGT